MNTFYSRLTLQLYLAFLLPIQIFAGTTPFITTWVTGNNVNTFNIPIDDTVAFTVIGTNPNYTVDWGDGTISNYTKGFATHSYLLAGEYTVEITGNISGIEFFNKERLISIDQWGNTIWEDSMEGMFSGCTNLQGNFTDTPNLSQVTNLCNSV